MNKIKKAVKASGNFVSAHKTAVAVLATAAIGVAINRTAHAEWNAFLEEKGLTEEYMQRFAA